MLWLSWEVCSACVLHVPKKTKPIWRAGHFKESGVAFMSDHLWAGVPHQPSWLSPDSKHTWSTGLGEQKIEGLAGRHKLFSRLYIACLSRDGNLDEFFRHENQVCSPALSDGLGLLQGVKSDLLSCLEVVCSEYSDNPKVTCTLIDGAAMAQMLKPSAVKTFNEYAHDIFHSTSVQKKKMWPGLIWCGTATCLTLWRQQQEQNVGKGYRDVW